MEKVFDTELLLARKLRALRIGPAEFLMARVAQDLGERLSTVERRFPKAATLFSLTGHTREALVASGKVDEVVRVEASAALLSDEPGIVSAPETVPFEPESLDLAVSLLSLHEANDIPGVLIQARRALKPDGLFLAAFAGTGTLAELRECLLAAETEISGGATPRIFPFVDVRDAGALLQRAGFALPVADHETLIVRYPHMFALMADLRAMGQTNALAARSRKTTRVALFKRAAELYAERFADADGRIRATFSIVWMSGWAPHEAQQKALKPGSAKSSLAEALDRINNNRNRD